MGEITKSTSPVSFNRDRLVWLLLALAAIAVYFFRLDLPLLGPDEPRYAQVAREMFMRGDWVTPTLGGFDWFEKPALLYWLQIFAYHIFGVSEFAARFGSAVCGLGTAAALWLLGRRVSTTLLSQSPTAQRQFLSADFANWLALAAASSIGLLVFARGASFDIILTFPITAALVCFFIDFLKFQKSAGYFSVYLAAFYAFGGLALIAKGLVGIVFPAAIVALFHFLTWEKPSRRLLFSLSWGTFVCLTVAALWYLPMYQTNGWKFIDEFFIQHHFQRYSSNKYLHPQPFWFFWVILPLMTIPWLPFLGIRLWRIVRNLLKTRFGGQTGASAEPDSMLQKFALAWMLMPLLFFSLSGSKLPGYILPALPGAIILAALEIANFVGSSAKRRTLLQTLAAATFLVIALLLQFVVEKAVPQETVKRLIEKADRENFAANRIINYQTISHNLEFYGADRLVRMPDGKQRRFDRIEEVAAFAQTEQKPLLVVVPVKNIQELLTNQNLNAEVLGDNTKLAIVAVTAK